MIFGKNLQASNIRKILIFSFSHIGDAVLSSAVIQPLQEHFADPEICVLVGPIAYDVFFGDARINEVIIYDNRGIHADLGGKRRLIKELKHRQFDLVVDLRDSFWSRFIGVPRFGAPLLKRFTSSYRSSHAVDRYLGILRSHGIAFADASPKFCLSDSERQTASDFLTKYGLTQNNLLIGIHPGGGWLYKLWPVDRFAALGDWLGQKYGAKILAFAGPDEAILQEQMVDTMQSTPIIVRDVGLRETAALIQKCHIYIGNDTGPMHVAAAVNTQVIAIFGPTDAGRSGPYGPDHIAIAEEIECNPCHPGRNPGGCGSSPCKAIEAVSVEQVAEIAGKILDEI